MKLFLQLRQLIKTACVIALTTATLASATQAQQPAADAATTASASEQQLTFEYLFFWKDKDARTQGILQSTQKEVETLGENVSLKQIGIKDPASAGIVDQYKVSRAPMPLVLCIASNGAVTKAFVSPFPPAQLREAIVSRGTAESFKALQENKIVVLCALNSDAQANETALSNANALKTDERFAQSVEVIAVDVHDQGEAILLAGVKLNATMAEPTIVILAPPGKQLATLTGAVTTAQIAEKLVAAQSTCCPGGQCGPNCCPGGKCPPPQKK